MERFEEKRVIRSVGADEDTCCRRWWRSSRIAFHVPRAKKPKVFVSYSRHDEALVKPLAGLLGVTVEDAVFLDVNELKPGDVWEEKIVAAVRESTVFVICWCCQSQKSEFVAREISLALEDGKKKLVPVLFCQTKLPADLATRQWIDLRGRILHTCDHVEVPVPPSIFPASPVSAPPPVRIDAPSPRAGGESNDFTKAEERRRERPEELRDSFEEDSGAMVQGERKEMREEPLRAKRMWSGRLLLGAILIALVVAGGVFLDFFSQRLVSFSLAKVLLYVLVALFLFVVYRYFSRSRRERMLREVGHSHVISPAMELDFVSDPDLVADLVRSYFEGLGKK